MVSTTSKKAGFERSTTSTLRAISSTMQDALLHGEGPPDLRSPVALGDHHPTGKARLNVPAVDGQEVPNVDGEVQPRVREGIREGHRAGDPRRASRPQGSVDLHHTIRRENEVSLHTSVTDAQGREDRRSADQIEISAGLQVLRGSTEMEIPGEGAFHLLDGLQEGQGDRSGKGIRRKP